MRTKFRALNGFLAAVIAVSISSCRTTDQETMSEIWALTVMENKPGTNEYVSPNRIKEKCIILPYIPGGNYSEKDKKKETKFCSVDLYSPSTALCPKTWSTSPGTIVYSFDGSVAPESFESEFCHDQDANLRGVKKIAKFKQTMNASGTSGTFSTASLLYYHLSRYFDTAVKVPVSVYREMDRIEHFSRVAKAGKRLSRHRMISAGWDHMYNAGLNPNSYSPTLELVTSDRTRFYGIFIKGGGERYGPEINGIRSKWGSPSSVDFQMTPAFTALRSDLPIKEAIMHVKSNYSRTLRDLRSRAEREGARENVQILRETYLEMDDRQMAYWMQELSEIAVFDYIFSQQDRVGNIDFKWYWYYIDGNGEVERKREKREEPRTKMHTMRPPAEIARFSPMLIQRTQLNDNDAGGRYAYANFTKKTEMLQNIRHLNAAFYEKLKKFHADMQSRGELYQYIENNFPLNDRRQIPQIITNTALAIDIFRENCRRGKIKFDLDGEYYFKHRDVPAQNVSCN